VFGAEKGEWNMLVELALSMYVGDACTICGAEMTMETLRTAVWLDGPAHKECYEEKEKEAEAENEQNT
jgi:hypothetical protein